ncbi:hypothetical protein [Streptomyces sp. KL116D]|uniref:hypothetical protein n=1 Tax=Streptomyces sp. KL116D TaxID=3045152 RepID=UPI0035578CC8
MTVTLFVALSLSSCSDSGEKESSANSTTAPKICAETLDTSAAASLERMGNASEFEEVHKFSPANVARHVQDDGAISRGCTIAASGKSSPAPIVQIEFTAISYEPNMKRDLANRTSGAAYYPVGVYAKMTSSSSGDIYFMCRTKGSNGTLPAVKAELWGGKPSTKAKSTDGLNVLMSVTRSVVKELGCSAESNIPGQVPAPLND